MKNETLVLGRMQSNKSYTIKRSYNGRSEEIIDTEIPGCVFAQQLVQEYKNQYGPDFDVWMEEEQS